MAKEKKLLDKRATRLQVMLTIDELAALDNFRFEKRMPSRAAAIREILLRGLSADGFSKAKAGSQSKSFGVIANGQARKIEADGR
jgi:hypothetical protein